MNHPIPSPRAGFSYVHGTTLTTGAPDTPAPASRVSLYKDGISLSLVRFGVSSEAGEYSLTSLPASRTYTVIAYDPAGVHDPVAKANLIPSPMPPDPAEHP